MGPYNIAILVRGQASGRADVVAADARAREAERQDGAPLYDDDETEEAPGVYPKTADVRPDYESNMTMDMHPEDLATLSAAERSRIAAREAGLDFGEFLPTGVETDHDFFCIGGCS